MKKQAQFFNSPAVTSPDRLVQICRDQQYSIQPPLTLPADDQFPGRLDPHSSVLFLPAIEEDCRGVKLAQLARLNGFDRVIVLYAGRMPSSDFLALAFREGADDIAALDASAEALEALVARAGRRLEARQSTATDAALQEKIHDMTSTIESLERDNAHWQERLLALAATAARLATGELNLGQSPPALQIAVAAQSQAESAAALALALGFDAKIAHGAQEALELIATRPPQVILTDGTLPDMDAQSFAHSARQVLGGKPVVIIAWSSSAQAKCRLLAPDSGLDDFVLKSSTGEGQTLLAAALLGGLR